MADTQPVDEVELRSEVQDKYREVALDPGAEYHFHTGRPLAARLGYDRAEVDALPDVAVESFAGVANPLSSGRGQRQDLRGNRPPVPRPPCLTARIPSNSVGVRGTTP